MFSSKETYEELLANIFGLFGVNDYIVAKRMTLEEYNIRMRGYLISQLEKEYEIHLLAFKTREAKATNKKGDKYYFEKFKDFYDKEKRRDEIFKPSYKNKRLIQIARNLQQARKEGKLNE